MAEFGNMDQVLGLLQQAFEATPSQAAQLQGAYGGVAGAQQQVTNAQIAQIQQQQIIDAQNNLGLLQAQQNTRRAATALGTNMDEVSEIVSLLGGQMRESALATVAQAKKVAHLEANNDLFMNPLGFLRDFAVGDRERSKLQGSMSVLTAASDSLHKLNQATQETAMTQKSIAETMSEASVQAHNEMLSARMEEIAAQGKLSMANTNVSRIKAIQQMNSEQLGYAMKAYDIRNSEDQRQYMNSLRAEAQEAKALEKQSEEEALTTMQRGAQVVGASLTDSQAKYLLKNNKEVANEYFKQGVNAQTADMLGLPQGYVPDTQDPEYNAEKLRMLGGTLSPAMQSTVNSVSRLRGRLADMDTLKQYFIAQGVDTKTANQSAATAMNGTQKERAELNEQVMRWLIAQQLAAPDDDIENNPYAIGAVDNISEDKLAANEFTSKYILPSVQAAKAAQSSYSLNFNSLADLASTAIKTDKIPMPTVVQGITDTVSELVALNNEVRNYRALGMPEQSSYRVRFGPQGRLVDMTDKAAVQEELVRFMAWQVREKMRPQQVMDTLLGPGANLPVSAPVLPPQ